MKSDKLKNLRHTAIIKKIVIFFVTFCISYSILVSALITKKYSLTEGEIAKSDIKATREIVDEASTQARIKQAEDSVPLQYNKTLEPKLTSIDAVKIFFSKLLSLKDSSAEDKDKLSSLKASTQIYLADDKYQALLKLKKEDVSSIQDFLIYALNECYDKNNIEDKDEDLNKAKDIITGMVNNSSLSQELKDLANAIAVKEIKPNFYYDKDKTEELKKAADKNIANIVIKKDQTVVKEGEPITANQIEILKNLGLLNNKPMFEWYLYLSLAILTLAILTLQWLYLGRYNKVIFQNNNKLALINILNCMSLILARTLSLISPYLIPLACVPMLMTILIDYKISLCISVFNVILISGIVNFNVEITLIAILNAVLGAIILKKMQARNDILYASLYLSVINILVTFSIGVILSNNIVEVIKKSSFSAFGGIISAVLTIGFLPFFESTFDIVTVIKLLELSNSNNPLLKKILIEAPGTYHHSLLVANLAEVATEEVGGNPILARVGAYYHDAGKILRPYFFKENQMGLDNPHDKITPNLSSLVITSHVKDGIELAKNANVPKVIQDIIEQHHGTSLVKYFYLTMKNSSTNPEEVKECDFRYPGPIPTSKEAGIIMLADGIEAAVRSIINPDKDKIESMVNNIIKDRISDGQLNNCDLTLRDIEKVRKSFLKTLTGIYHQRIEYPTDKSANLLEGKK